MDNGRGRGEGEICPFSIFRTFICRWAPVLVWMAVISYFSSRSTLPSPFSSSRYGPFFHSVAHFGEYAILVALLYRALSGGWPVEEQPVTPMYSGPLAGKGQLVYSFLIGLLFALLDELHQGFFVPGRDAELADLVLDAMGMGVALIVIGGWYCFRERSGVADRGGA